MKELTKRKNQRAKKGRTNEGEERKKIDRQMHGYEDKRERKRNKERKSYLQGQKKKKITNERKEMKKCIDKKYI